jgi:uridine kinase
MKQIDIYCKNNQIRKSYPIGMTLEEIAGDLGIHLENRIVGALVNNKLKELSYMVYKPKTIEFIDFSHPDGRRMYIRSLLFVLYAAVRENFPGITLKISHGISNGYYAELLGLGRAVTESDVFAIEQEMLAMVEEDYPFEKMGFPTQELVEIFRQQGLSNKAHLFEQQGSLYSFAYFMNGLANYFYGHLLPSTGYISLFGLEKYYDGILIRVPHPKNIKVLLDALPQDKLFGVFQEHKDWAEILKVSTIAELNDLVMDGRGGDIIKISEALHEKKVAEIANQISALREEVRLVLIAGPSSSGKTTFTKRLGVQLAVNGLWPHMISVDDYFVNREQTPKDENGDYDFESLYAIDIDFLNHQILELFDGKEVELPKFSFQTGERSFDGRKLKLAKGDILLIEGIHCLNPALLPHVDKKHSFRIFLSALTQISIDEQNYISTSDNRLIRRMIRDSKFRGYPARETIRRWPMVRKGEERNIFPYQENADVMYNSATLYELAILKKHAEPLLLGVSENQEEYSESTRLLKFLYYFKQLEETEIPPTSIIREFLGGSSFVY